MEREFWVGDYAPGEDPEPREEPEGPREMGFWSEEDWEELLRWV